MYRKKRRTETVRINLRIPPKVALALIALAAVLARLYQRLKESGASIVPKGQASDALESLLGRLRTMRLFLLECGELEGFNRRIGGHGLPWVSEVLQSHSGELATAEILGPARTFVRHVLGWNAEDSR